MFGATLKIRGVRPNSPAITTSVLFNQLAQQYGLPISCAGIEFHPQLQFHDADDSERKKLATLYIQEMAIRGCHGYPAFYLNAAQTDADVEQTIDAARETFAVMSDGLQRGNIDDLLQCELRQDAFRRLVR